MNRGCPKKVGFSLDGTLVEWEACPKRIDLWMDGWQFLPKKPQTRQTSSQAAKQTRGGQGQGQGVIIVKR